ncbi:vomeronasal type-2 receptor 26-like [Ambystoma mexicanum]|uniref:vomeronasal type-2 receptor 26-like n=1 Tax=Ambystoma mexicanum TaxID=8296 RepID=UPI0037E7A134
MLTDTLVTHADKVFSTDLKRPAQLGKKESWEEVPRKVTAVGTSTRTVKDIKKRWDDLHLRVRNILSAKRREAMATGSRDHSPTKLTRWEETCSTTISMESIQRFGDMEAGVPTSADGGTDADSEGQEAAAQAMTSSKGSRASQEGTGPSTSGATPTPRLPHRPAPAIQGRPPEKEKTSETPPKDTATLELSTVVEAEVDGTVCCHQLNWGAISDMEARMTRIEARQDRMIELVLQYVAEGELTRRKIRDANAANILAMNNNTLVIRDILAAVTQVLGRIVKQLQQQCPAPTVAQAATSSPSSSPASLAPASPVHQTRFSVRYYRDVLAMVFATEEINQNPHLLPNTTLGFHVYDSCMSESRAIGAVLELLSGKLRLIPGYRCPVRPLLAGIIGESLSSLSVPIARIMGVLRYPQVSHASVLSSLSDKVTFPSFLRTVPSDTFQNTALARLIGHFHWTWVGMIISNDEVGLKGGQHIWKAIEDNGGCVAFMEQVNLRFSKEKVLQLASMIRRHTVKVIIVHSPDVHVILLLQTLYEQNVKSKVWIFTAAFTMGPGLLGDQAWKVLNGSLGLAPYTEQMLNFEEFLCHLHSSRYLGDTYMKLLWKKAFHCIFPDAPGSEGALPNLEMCSRNATLDNISRHLFELNDLSYTYHSYIAVYTFAHALEALISCTPGHGPFLHGSCAGTEDIRPWQVLHYLRNVHFKTGTGREIFFDVNGDAPAAYDILNVQILADEEFQLVKVGKVDPTAEDGQYLIISSGGIVWSDGSSQLPRSVCSDSCPPGYRKAAREGEPVCCFNCVHCSQGEVSSGTDAANCIKCLDSEWPNERRDQCIQKVIEVLTFEEPLGLMLTTSATSMTILTASVLYVFIKYQDTPIVKANNRGLSYLLLLSLMLCFLCTFIFISRPQRFTCMLRQTVFGVVFSISVSSILAKTCLVVLAFKATNPNSPVRQWLGSKAPLCIVLICSLFQIVICAAWLLNSPPFPELNMTSYKEKIIFECNEGDAIFFYCMLGYMGLLAIVSFIVAFLSRNLPGSFNEAKLITFSMLVFVSVWISFIPAYLSTRGKYMVAVEVFAILCSSAGLLGCIFIPKCYIILVRPERNTSKYLMRKAQFGRKTNAQ